MRLSPSRALVAAGALLFTLGVASAAGARSGARPAGRKSARPVATRTTSTGAKPVRTKQLKALRPAKSKRVKRPLARKPVRRVTRRADRRNTAEIATTAPTAGGPLSVVKGLIGGLAEPAEALLAQITTSLVKYQLTLREPNPFTGEVQTVAMTQVEEVALGEAIVRQMVPTMGIPLSGRPMERYLDAIVQRLVRANGIDTLTPYRFKVHLVHTDEPNAFAAPGGRIVVTTGILRLVKSEAAIATILAHEIGHVVARHGSQNIARSELVQELLTSLGLAAGNDIGARVAVLKGAGDLRSAMLSFSRDQEYQSDGLGVRFAARAGYDARGVEEMADFLQSINGHLTFDDSHDDHPSPLGRRLVLFAAARQHGMTYQGDHGVDRFTARVAMPLALGVF